jgi:hypothetical protein
LCGFATFVVGIIGGELEAADGALVVLAEPLGDAVLVEQVAARELAGPFLQVLTADRASRVFFDRATLGALAVFVRNVKLGEFVHDLFAGWRGAAAATIHL